MEDKDWYDTVKIHKKGFEINAKRIGCIFRPKCVYFFIPMMKLFS